MIYIYSRNRHSIHEFMKQLFQSSEFMFLERESTYTFLRMLDCDDVSAKAHAHTYIAHITSQLIYIRSASLEKNIDSFQQA